MLNTSTKEIYPFLIYGLIAWGNTYNTTLQPIYILRKKAVRVISFSSFDHHSNPLFKLLDIIIFPDLVKYYIGIFMYKYHNQLLPSVFNSFFTKVDQVHSYNTQHTSKLSYYLPKVRTNYWKFNIRFQGPMKWNSIDEDFKRSSLSLFKLKLKEHLTDNY